MKYYKLLFLLFCIFTESFLICSCRKNCVSSNSFTLDVFVKGIKDSEPVFLSYLQLKDNKCYEVIDTAKLINGKYSFKGMIDEITPADIFFDNACGVRIYLEPTNMKLSIDKTNSYKYNFSGTSIDKESFEFKKVVGYNEEISNSRQGRIMDLSIQMRGLSENESAKIDSLMDLLCKSKAEYVTNNEEICRKRLAFFYNHLNYQIAPDLLLMSIIKDTLDIKEIIKLYESLPEKSKNSLMGKLVDLQINEILDIRKSLVGCPAPDFIRTDFLKKTIKLSDYRNKSFVLLDFWASWCKPCLESIPKIKGLHENYSNNGLTIIGISCDKDTVRWKDTIRKYELSKWPQILSKERDDIVFADISNIYDVQQIPLCVLIDKKGQVVARWQYLGEEELTSLKKILKENVQK